MEDEIIEVVPDPAPLLDENDESRPFLDEKDTLFIPIRKLKDSRFITGENVHCFVNITLQLFCIMGIGGIVGLVIQQQNGYIAMIVLGGLFSCFLLPAYCSKSKSALEFNRNNWLTEEELRYRLKTHEEVEPKVHMYMECFHRERAGSNEREVISERVNEDLPIEGFHDFSTPFDYKDSRNKPVRMFIHQCYRHQDKDAINAMDEARKTFIDTNKTRDTNYRWRETYNDEALPPLYMLSYKESPDTAFVPWYYSDCLYKICTYLTCSWYWRFLVNCCCSKSIIYTSLKEVSARKRDEHYQAQIDEEKPNHAVVI